jgi:hypothetical protein
LEPGETESEWLQKLEVLLGKDVEQVREALPFVAALLGLVEALLSRLRTSRRTGNGRAHLQCWPS